MTIKSIFTCVALVSVFALAPSAYAKDGKVWSGQCHVTTGDGKGSSSSCSNPDVTCRTNNTCTWNGMDGDVVSDIPSATADEQLYVPDSGNAETAPPLTFDAALATCRRTRGVKLQACIDEKTGQSRQAMPPANHNTVRRRIN